MTSHICSYSLDKSFAGKVHCKHVGPEGENMISAQSGQDSGPNSGRDFFAFDSTSLGSGSGCSDAVTASIKYSTGIDCGRGSATDTPTPASRSTCTPMSSPWTPVPPLWSPLRHFWPPSGLWWTPMAPFWTPMTCFWPPIAPFYTYDTSVDTNDTDTFVDTRGRKISLVCS